MTILSDFLVVGGGLMGSAVASSLAMKNKQVIMLDEGDLAFRASRSNFGLIWVQGKGVGMPDYVSWTLQASKRWKKDFKDFLQEETGYDLHLRHKGGLVLLHGDQEVQERQKHLGTIEQEGYDTPTIAFLNRKETQALFPDIKLGERVLGASYCEEDADLNPLYLLKALHQLMIKYGGQYHANQKAINITYDEKSKIYTVKTQNDVYQTPKLIITAGNHSVPLARQVGIPLELRAEHGQILALGRAKQVIPYPLSGIKQNAEGSIILGATKNDFGFNDASIASLSQKLAERAIASFPDFKSLNLVRTWAGLRVLTPDSYPVYCESESHPNSYVLISHSAVTLAPNHFHQITNWILNNNEKPRELDSFHYNRFQ